VPGQLRIPFLWRLLDCRYGSTLVFHLNFRLFPNGAYVYGSFPDELKPVKLTMHKRGLDAYQAACARL